MRWLFIALALGYFIALPFSCRGCGYPGYGGVYRPSLFYWGGVPTFHDPSARSGSLGGPNRLGGGPRGGK